MVALIGTGATVAGLTTAHQLGTAAGSISSHAALGATPIPGEGGEVTATYGRDISVTAITAPKEVATGSQYNVDVTLKNVGPNSFSGHSLTLYVDGQQYEKVSCKGTLESDAQQVVTFNLTMHPLREDPLKINAVATLSRDDDKNNNNSDTITVTPVVSKLAKITDLSYEGDMYGVTLKWSEPAYKTDGSGAQLKGYNVWMNNEKVNTDPVQTTEFKEPNPGYGNTYKVTAVYDLGESSASNVVTLDIGLKNGKGTKEDPYTISNADELKFFFSVADKDACEGKYYLQTQDIDLNGAKMTLPLATTQFQGNYDGGSHALKNLNLVSGTEQKAGMFATLGDKSVVRNLTLEGDANITQMYSAPLVGYCYGTLEGIVSKMNITTSTRYVSGIASEVMASSKFTDCEFSGKLTTSYDLCGGMAGRSNGGTFINCKFTGEIANTSDTRSGLSWMGGIAGYSYPSTYVNCISDGKFPADELGLYRGGIVGFCYATPTAANHGTFTFKNCVNRTPIKGSSYLAGISGYVAFLKYGSSNYMYKNYMNVDSCVNYGDIYTTGDNNHTGGILGSYTHSTRVTDCDNYGNITSPSPVGVGGITGSYMESPTDSTQSTFLRCRNFGKIEALDPDSVTAVYLGGILGDATTWTNVVNCENHNDVIGMSEIGGIVGYCFFNNLKISGCVNYGNVKASYYRAGGIIGMCYNETNEVSNCVNYGAVSSRSTRGGLYGHSAFGIGGITGHASGTYVNNLNAGSVTGSAYVGGIIGVSKAGYVKVANCLNTGEVSGRKISGGNLVNTLDSVGAIIGIKVDGTDTNWYSEKSSQENNYYTPNVLSAYKDIPESYLTSYAGSEMTEKELVGGDKLGKDWTAYDKYCMPLPAGVPDSDSIKVWAARVVPGKDKDVLPNVSGDFFVGAPEGLIWTALPDKITFSGNKAEVAPNTQEEVVLTAKCGEASKEVRLSVDMVTSVKDLEADEVLEEKWYDMNGLGVACPETFDGNAYVVVRTYRNGTTKAVKVLNVK